jgi:hypothetical protein
MRRADARSRQTDRPRGVAATFQVIANKIEPAVSNRALNLFAKQDARLALGNELEPRRPKMARIGAPSFAPGRGEGLAGTRAGPDGAIVGPSGEAQGDGPTPDPGEEVALVIPGEIARSNIDN